MTDGDAATTQGDPGPGATERGATSEGTERGATSDETAVVRRSELLLAATVVFWGTNFIVLKVALDALPALVLNAGRFTVSALVVGVAYLRGKPDGESFFAPLATHPVAVTGLGLLGYLCFPVAFIFGVERTTAGNAALIMASAPVVTALVGRLTHIEALTGRAWGGLAVTLVGTAVVVVGGSQRLALDSATLVGNLLMVAAAALWGSYTVLNRPVLREVSPTALTFFGVLVSLPVQFGLAAPALGTLGPAAFAPAILLAVGYAGAFGAGLGFLWWNVGVRAIGPSRVAVYGNLVPVVALVAGWAALGESVVVPQLVGATLILGGVFLVRRERPRVYLRHERVRQY